MVLEDTAGGVDGGSLCHMLILRNIHVALSNLKKLCCPVNFKKASCRHVDFLKVPCHMSLISKKAHVTMSTLGVYTPKALAPCRETWDTRLVGPVQTFVIYSL